MMTRKPLSSFTSWRSRLATLTLAQARAAPKPSRRTAKAKTFPDDFGLSLMFRPQRCAQFCLLPGHLATRMEENPRNIKNCRTVETRPRKHEKVSRLEICKLLICRQLIFCDSTSVSRLKKSYFGVIWLRDAADWRELEARRKGSSTLRLGGKRIISRTCDLYTCTNITTM